MPFPWRPRQGCCGASRRRRRTGPCVEELAFGSHEPVALEPVRVFEAAHRALRELEPALLVVDDLQWLDELSLALCHYLIRAACDSEQHIAIFAASRLDESGSALGESLPRERVVRIELGPLGRNEGVELALALDSALDSASAAQLWERAQGSPFWLEALARAGGATAGSDQLLTPRLRGASSDAVFVLGVLAVAGRPISVADLDALEDWPSARRRGRRHGARQAWACERVCRDTESWSRSDPESSLGRSAP